MDSKGLDVDVTIIVPVFKHWDLAFSLFEKLASQVAPSVRWELVVVDNGSDDLPSQKELPDFATLLVCETPGSYAARNMGARYAKGELYLFTDADCEPSEQWVEEHWRAYQLHGDSGINAGAVDVCKLGSGELNDYELYDSFLGLPQERYVTKRGYAVTANLAIPKKVFDLVGGFDERRFSGGDADFCNRARKQGAVLRYAADAVVFHPARRSWEELETKARRVKGGQLCSGSFIRRLFFFGKSFIYPILKIIRVLKSGLSWDEKKRIVSVIAQLGIVEMREVFSLILGGSPERR